MVCLSSLQNYRAMTELLGRDGIRQHRAGQSQVGICHLKGPQGGQLCEENLFV